MTAKEIAKIHELLDQDAQTYVRDYKTRVIDALRKMEARSKNPELVKSIIATVETIPAIDVTRW